MIPRKDLSVVIFQINGKQTFKAAGISKKDLQNPETAKVIYETLSQFNEVLTPAPTPDGPTDAPSDAPPMDAPPMDAPPMDAPPMDAPPMDAPSLHAPPLESGHIEQTVSSEKRPPPTAEVSSSGGHDDLLASIRQGTKLRSVQPVQSSGPREVKGPSSSSSSSALPDLSRMTSTQTNTVMSALQKAMLERGKVLQVEEEEDNEKDDWDD